MLNAVGIDVAKRKSTVTIRRPGDEIVLPPCDIHHTQSEINDLIALIGESNAVKRRLELQLPTSVSKARFRHLIRKFFSHRPHGLPYQRPVFAV